MHANVINIKTEVYMQHMHSRSELRQMDFVIASQLNFSEMQIQYYRRKIEIRK